MPASPVVKSSVVTPTGTVAPGTALTWVIDYTPGKSDKVFTETGELTDSVTGLSSQVSETFTVADDTGDPTTITPSASNTHVWDVVSNVANTDGSGDWTATLTATA